MLKACSWIEYCFENMSPNVSIFNLRTNSAPQSPIVETGPIVLTTSFFQCNWKFQFWFGIKMELLISKMIWRRSGKSFKTIEHLKLWLQRIQFDYWTNTNSIDTNTSTNSINTNTNTNSTSLGVNRFRKLERRSLKNLLKSIQHQTFQLQHLTNLQPNWI